jgi:hypothetical protein
MIQFSTMMALQLSRCSVKQAVFGPKIITEKEYKSYSPWHSSALEGRRFKDIENMQKNAMMALKAIIQQEFQKCFHQ